MYLKRFWDIFNTHNLYIIITTTNIFFSLTRIPWSRNCAYPMQAPKEQWKNQPLIHYPGGTLKHHLTLGSPPYIQIPETWKFVLVEPGTLGFCSTELSSRNLESKSHLAPKIHNPRRRIQNPKLSWISFYGAIEWITKTWNNSGTILFNVLAAFQGLTHTEKVEFTKQRLFSSTKKAHRAFLHSHNLR